ncbi:polar amino acid transport system permease protein [Friedmanniella endophytica]|uniref:Polar amino acid transport system permease protein n=1 Tax=Microlunatus kandeliicorticis TaxID=1759536 RepID=A0A7W3P726_9ACTN|nr:amino acid ABC transporter permease [Microlunatus kandeliicorticis]MBA8795584.1 polar amino acid transport system permease protein [Microlunatus kandeliicorticis]
MTAGPAGEPTSTRSAERPGRIEAVGVRHYGRWVAVAVIVVLVAMFVNMIIFNPVFNWPFVFEVMNQAPVIQGLFVGTLLVTVLTMIVGIAFGVLLAVMRLSDNPILRGVSWVYTWVFRSIPRIVLLTFMGAAMGLIFPKGIALGVPFDWKIIEALGLRGDWRFATFDANTLFGGFLGAIIGLGASEAAYMAEIARAGILSVDKGQREAALALGMKSPLAMRRIVLPQAMRVIVPPTGNETIAMMKDTSLLIVLGSFTSELFYQVGAIANRTYQIVPSYLAAVLYYLIVTSIMMVGQAWLERHFGRGFGARSTRAQARAALAAGAGH